MHLFRTLPLLARISTVPDATQTTAADPLPTAPQNNTRGWNFGLETLGHRGFWGISHPPHAADPEQGQAREQARALQVQPRHRRLDARALRHNVQAPIVRHITLQQNHCT